MVDFNNLPVVVTEAGLYKTRGGKFVTVHEINFPPNFTAGTCFPAKGSKWTKQIGQVNPPYEIWHLNGRVDLFKESDWDLVSFNKE